MAPDTMATRWSMWRRALLVGAILSPIGAAANGLSGFLYVTAGATVVAAIVLATEAWARRRLRLVGAPGIPVLGFIAWGLLPTFLAVSALTADSPGRGSFFLAAYVVAWWLVAILLIRGVLAAIVPALALMAVPWSFFAVQAVAGVFILGDMGLRGAMSPGTMGLVFSVAALMTLVVFAPLTLIAVRLVNAFRRERRRRRDMTLSALPRSA